MGDARQSGAPAGPGATASAAPPDRRHSIRSADAAAGAAADRDAADADRLDRVDHRNERRAGFDRLRHAPGEIEVAAMDAQALADRSTLPGAAGPAAKPDKSKASGLMRTLLYGR